MQMSGHVYYPDGASYQAGIKLDGWLAAMFKATEDTGYRNPAYSAQMSEAARVGAKAGAYHFLHAGNGPAQADFAFSVVGANVPLMIDCEPETGAGSYPTAADAEQFADRYRSNGGIVHLVYYPEWYWKQQGEPILSGLASRGLSLVTSVYSGNPEDTSGPGWTSYGGMGQVYTWQYTSSGTVNGMGGVDVNCFRGSGSADVQTTLSELWALWTTGSISGQGPVTDWTETMIMALPVLQQGEQDAPGQIMYVHRAQALAKVIGQINSVTAASSLVTDGVFGPATTAGVKGIQQLFGVTQDGIVGPVTWHKLVAGY